MRATETKAGSVNVAHSLIMDVPSNYIYLPALAATAYRERGNFAQSVKSILFYRWLSCALSGLNEINAANCNLHRENKCFSFLARSMKTK